MIFIFGVSMMPGITRTQLKAWNVYLKCADDVFGVLQCGVELRVGDSQVLWSFEEFDELHCRVEFVLDSTGFEVYLQTTASEVQ